MKIIEEGFINSAIVFCVCVCVCVCVLHSLNCV
jgi:hypothetical protein